MRAEAPRVTARMPSADGTRRARDRSPSSARPLRRPDARGRRPAPGGAPARGRHGRDHPSASGRPGSTRSRFALSNWRVRWRLAALIAVPLLTAVVLGALTIDGDVSSWQTTGRVQHLAQLNSAVVKYIQAVEDERDYSVASTANRGGFSARLRTAQRVTDGRRRTGQRLGRWHHGRRRLSARRGTGGERGTSGRATLPFVREAVADPLFPSTAIMQVYTVNVIQPANSSPASSGTRPAIPIRSPERRHRPGRTAPGRRLLVGSAGPPAEGGQFAAAVAVVRRRCQPPAGPAAGSGGPGQLQRIRRSRRAAELQRHGERAAGR